MGYPYDHRGKITEPELSRPSPRNKFIIIFLNYMGRGSYVAFLYRISLNLVQRFSVRSTVAFDKFVVQNSLLIFILFSEDVSPKTTVLGLWGVLLRERFLFLLCYG